MYLPATASRGCAYNVRMLLLWLALSVDALVAVCPEGMALVPERVAQGEEAAIELYCLDLTEVTVVAYQECVRAGACEPPGETVAVPDLREGDIGIWSRSCNGHRGDRREHPVNCVHWTQAEAYCAAAGKRLPTEVEWEWAASGGDEKRRYPWGGQRPSPQRLNACGFECAERLRRLGRPRPPLHFGEDGFEDTAPAGSFPDGAGRWGHLDLAGNVWEFTTSPFADDPRVRVIRGGGWAQSRSEMIRTVYRGGYLTTARGSAVGFRCAATLVAPGWDSSVQNKELLP